MNREQRRAVQVILVILGCFAIFTYTYALEAKRYCDWTGLEIQERLGHEVTFTLTNGSVRHYCCINVSLEALQDMIQRSEEIYIERIQIRCPMCGMLMDSDDPMIVWVYSEEYLNPTTHTATIVGVCEDAGEQAMCESHFIDQYGGTVISSPYVF